jgi:hypothetical protein
MREIKHESGATAPMGFAPKNIFLKAVQSTTAGSFASLRV